MPLIEIGSGEEITTIPFNKQFTEIRKRLSVQEFERIVRRINELIDATGGEVATAGWLPGNDWTGTEFEVIYTKAARKDYGLSAKFFGVCVWYTMMHRPERWASGRYEKDGKDIGSRTYFVLKKQ